MIIKRYLIYGMPSCQLIILGHGRLVNRPSGWVLEFMYWKSWHEDGLFSRWVITLNGRFSFLDYLASVSTRNVL